MPPMRKGDRWEAIIDLATGKVRNWPEGRELLVSMKVCDEGTYALLDENDKVIGKVEQDYVPHGVVPGWSGDYIIFFIGPDGVVREHTEDGETTRWPKPDEFDFEDFFRGEQR